MINTIWLSVRDYRVKHGRHIALEVRMHPAIFDECKSCDHNSYMTAFNAGMNKPIDSIFDYPLVLDESLNEDEYRVQSPRINQN